MVVAPSRRPCSPNGRARESGGRTFVALADSLKAERPIGPRVALDPLVPVSLGLVIAVLALVFTVRYYHDRVGRLKDEMRALASSKQSLATTYGRITEQWAPFMAGYPYDPRNFRFLGSPIDGVQFEDDRIVFVEFKANQSRLTDRERRMRELVEQGRVEWLELRLDERGVPRVAQPHAHADARAPEPEGAWAPPSSSDAPPMDESGWQR